MTTVIDYDNLPHHPRSEALVDAIGDKVNSREKNFFRVHVAHYMCLMASMMRTNVCIPGHDPSPVCMYAMNLAASGFGKGVATALIEKKIINEFQRVFINTTYRDQVRANLPRLAGYRAARNGTDIDEELVAVESEFKRTGHFLFSFDSATTAAVKQKRSMLLMANSGSINLQTDEIGANLSGNKDIMTLFLELFEGSTKPKLIKNTNDSIRSEEILGNTPTNMMLFGVPHAVFDDGKVQEETLAMFSMGYARRMIFGYASGSIHEMYKDETAQSMLDRAKSGKADKVLSSTSKYFGQLADIANSHRDIQVPDATGLLYNQYFLDCVKRASVFRQHEELLKVEMQNRNYKAMKYAAALAFVDQSPEVTPDHYLNAIALTECSGKDFSLMLNRDRAHVKLAKYLAQVNEDVTQSDLLEDMPNVYKGTKQQRDELVTNAIAWGYKNNIVIHKSYRDSVEFLSGEPLKATDLSNIKIAYSTSDITTGYQNDSQPFDQLHQMINHPNVHWINHHLTHDYRHDDNCVPGFNIVVIDVDNQVSMEAAKQLLYNYKALYYTTKRHDPNASGNRFRIVIPTNYELKLDRDTFKAFMQNLYEWLPFSSDEATGQRARKWLSHNAHYEYTDGQVLDVLPFIPNTSKNTEMKEKHKALHSMDALERWMILNMGDGNRNNMLIRYALTLVDNNCDLNTVRTACINLNQKLPDPLPDMEILNTVVKTAGKRISEKANV